LISNRIFYKSIFVVWFSKIYPDSSAKMTRNMVVGRPIFLSVWLLLQLWCSENSTQVIPDLHKLVRHYPQCTFCLRKSLDLHMRSIHLFTPLMGQHFYSTVFLMAFLRRMIQIWSGNATSKVVYVAYNSMSWAKLEYMQSGNPKAIYSMPNFACNLVKKCWKKL